MTTRPRDYEDPSTLPHLRGVTTQDGFTVLLPAVRANIADSTATQRLPRIPAQQALPPSVARHADAANWYGRMAEEEWPDVPSGQGRHVLDELMAEDDTFPDLTGHDEPDPIVQGSHNRMLASAGIPVEGLAAAVRFARQAHAFFTARLRWCDRAERELSAWDRRIAEFNASWDEQLRKAKVEFYGEEAVVAEERLIEAYEAGKAHIAAENARRAAAGEAPLDVTPTSFTKDMQAQLRQMLAEHALTGSAVSR